MWNNWKENPPILITCHIRQGITASVDLIVIDEDGVAHDDVFRGDDGRCYCCGGGGIADPMLWAYAPNAWNGVVIDKAGIEIELIKKLMEAGLLANGDPEEVANDLYDP